jgi:capsular exopolysaccharide synthesis family protein
LSEIRTNGKGYIVPASIESGETKLSEAAGEEYALTFRDVRRFIRKRIRVILLVAVAFAGAAVGFNLMQTPMYQASIKIVVGAEYGIIQTPEDAIGLQQLTPTMAEGVNSRPIAQAVIQQQNLRTTPGTFLENLKAEQVGSTQFIEVTYTDSDPERARRVANAVGEVFSERLSSNTNKLTATVWEPAVTPEEPVSPNPVRNGLLALMLGLMLGVMLAALMEYFDNGWRSSDEVEQISGTPTYGTIPTFGVAGGKKQGTRMDRSPSRTGARRVAPAGAETDNPDGLAGALITVLDPASLASEAYRKLRTKLLYAPVDHPPKVIVLTSPGPDEGKSTTCANLGVVLAQEGKDALIIDCDFRQPAIHKFFGLRNLYGLTDVVAGERSLQEVLHEPVQNLKVVTVGPIPPNPAEILSPQRLSQFLASVRQRFDYVLIDAPPVELVSDPAILAVQGDGVLMVMDAQRTHRTSVYTAMRDLEAVGANVLGTVMNNCGPTEDDYYPYD